ncbi:cyclin-dependent kinase inhibitor 7-like isoform X2 [Gossypium australe]|uniref:Cyclin-dependent kinase inhibitor n=1 Tax=Gossypium australe TaxID=47621 RepID=A0A5B6WFS1_9ROSI|nr:cyclin-dependent kinase inhibitor 7-like isoform X2 [Gossypium australe]
MRRKCRTVEGIAVMELDDVGVRTIAMAEAATAAVRNKRRRFNDDDEGEAAECKVTSSTTSYIQLRSRRILVDHHPRNENQCLSPSSDHDDDVSCCSSIIGSCGKRIIELPDLEDESIEVESATHFSSRDRRETTPLSELRAEPEDMDSTSRPSGGNSRRRSMVEKMPTEAELEDFFVVAEEKLRNQFAEKYNYDILKDQPLEGRYEWARLKP